MGFLSYLLKEVVGACEHTLLLLSDGRLCIFQVFLDSVLFLSTLLNHFFVYEAFKCLCKLLDILVPFLHNLAYMSHILAPVLDIEVLEFWYLLCTTFVHCIV